MSIQESAAFALEITGLVRRFGDYFAVDNIDLTIRRGAVVALLGPSGCGKTTILRLIAGLDQPDGGAISIFGSVVQAPGRHVPPEARGVGLVFQDNVLFPHLSVEENVGYGVPRRARRSIAVSALEMVGLAGLGSRRTHELSGGQQQRAVLARTLAAQQKLVLLDEPFSRLDTHLREQVRRDMINAIKEAGSTALLVTHDQGEALAIADEVVVMSEGRIHQVGTPREIYQNPADQFVAKFIGDATFLPTTWVSETRVRTAVGELEVTRASRPDRSIAVVRPEAVVIRESGKNTAQLRRACVREVQFHGRDQLVELELECGTSILSRTAGTALIAVGSTISIEIQGEVSLV